MRVIIAGSRHLNDPRALAHAVERWEALYGVESISEVLSGGARGADALGEAWATQEGIPIRRFKAEWKRYGKAAGPIRNRAMLAHADGVIALPRGGRGTAHLIREAERLGIPIIMG